jgi:hypothetical protein
MTAAPAYFERPVLDRSGPIRSAGTFYRVADDDPDAIGGVPLTSVETAATAAVRLGYKVASAQIDRATRIANRLRAEGDRAAGVRRADGDSSEKQALDATEQLVFKAILAGLSWLEGFAAAPGNPMKRFGAAQFRLLGSMLGVTEHGAATAGVGPAIEALRDLLQQVVESAGAGPRPDAQGFEAGTAPAVTTVRVTHASPAAGRRSGTAGRARAVRVTDWEIAPGARGRFPLVFYGDEPKTAPLRGELNLAKSIPPMLTLRPMAASTRRGAYRAAICNGDGLQLGYIGIAL